MGLCGVHCFRRLCGKESTEKESRGDLRFKQPYTLHGSTQVMEGAGEDRTRTGTIDRDGASTAGSMSWSSSRCGWVARLPTMALRSAGTEGDAAYLDSRNSVGRQPAQRLNARRNARASEYPTASAISAMLNSEFSRRSRAHSYLASSRISR